MRYLLSMSLTCLLIGFAVVKSDARTIHVPSQFATIQAAVDAAAPGDSIHVSGGVYANETHPDTIDPTQADSGVLISTQNIDIVGEDEAVLAGPVSMPTDGVTVIGIDIEAPGCTVRGLTVRNFEVGIKAGEASERVQANTVTACNVGILCVFPPIDETLNTTIDHNGCNGNLVGIELDGCSIVTVAHNIADNNSQIGIWLTFPTYGCTITHNEANDNGSVEVPGTGIQVDAIANDTNTNLPFPNLLTQNSAFGNSIDAVDSFGVNIWAHNKFGTQSGF